MTITDFLLARIAEDADLAHYGCEGVGEYSRCGAMSDKFEGMRSAIRRVVTECEAGDQAWPGCENDLRFGQILRALATIYADHPDYDPEWTPRA